MPIQTTTDKALLKSFHREREEAKLNALVAQSVAELAQAEADLRDARAHADIAAVEEFDARREKDRLTRQFEEDMQATAIRIGQAQVAKNHVIAMSHEERRARGQLQNVRQRLEEWT